MAWIADADLAASVSNAGGLGVIAAGNAPPSWVKEQIDKIRTLTDRPFGVNIMLLSPYVKEVAELAATKKFPWLSPVREIRETISRCGRKPELRLPPL